MSHVSSKTAGAGSLHSLTYRRQSFRSALVIRGLPPGLKVVAADPCDMTTIRLAELYEREFGGFRIHPITSTSTPQHNIFPLPNSHQSRCNRSTQSQYVRSLAFGNHRFFPVRRYWQFTISAEGVCYVTIDDRKRLKEKVIPGTGWWVGSFLSGLESSKHWDQRCREYYGELEQRVAGWQYAHAAESVPSNHRNSHEARWPSCLAGFH